MPNDENSASGQSSSAASDVRTAAKFLIAAFGAVGAVLVANLSFSSLASGQHPFVAGAAAAGAVISVAVAISLVVDVLVPSFVSLGQLATLQGENPDNELIKFLTSNSELFQGHGPGLATFRRAYLDALEARKTAQEEYLANVASPEQKTKAQVADARQQFLDQAVDSLLSAAADWQIIQCFKDRRLPVTAAAVATAAAAGVFAWASAKPTIFPASLRGARLVNADLRGAELRGADLSGTNFKGSNLEGANLTGATVNGTTVWKNAICPDGTHATDAHNSCSAHLMP